MLIIFFCFFIISNSGLKKGHIFQISSSIPTKIWTIEKIFKINLNVIIELVSRFCIFNQKNDNIGDIVLWRLPHRRFIKQYDTKNFKNKI